MSIQVLMPALSPTMEEGTIAKWLVKAGDHIKPGDIIAEIETDKATMEVEAVDEGVVSEILVPAGTQNVKVNEPIAVVAGDNAESQPKAEERDVKAKSEATATKPVKTEAKPEEKKSSVAKSAPAKQPGASGDAAATTVRDALRDAMAEEMRRDPNVFLMGEEVGQYQGA
ncbi:MAG: biotin/lipoyl-containing protein, partial [Caulobacterales bacterium]